MEEGLGLSSVIVVALIHSGMPHSVSIGSRSGLCVQPLTGTACALPLVSTLHSLPKHPAHNKSAFNCILGPSCSESSEVCKGPGPC